MGAQLDAILFWGLDRVSLDIDAAEPALAAHRCELVFHGDHLALAVVESITRHSMWGSTPVERSEVGSDWALRLQACAAALGLSGAPGWHLACSML